MIVHRFVNFESLLQRYVDEGWVAVDCEKKDNFTWRPCSWACVATVRIRSINHGNPREEFQGNFPVDARDIYIYIYYFLNCITFFKGTCHILFSGNIVVWKIVVKRSRCCLGAWILCLVLFDVCIALEIYSKSVMWVVNINLYLYINIHMYFFHS